MLLEAEKVSVETHSIGKNGLEGYLNVNLQDNLVWCLKVLNKAAHKHVGRLLGGDILALQPVPRKLAMMSHESSA